jgi:hypothetical protein
MGEQEARQPADSITTGDDSRSTDESRSGFDVDSREDPTETGRDRRLTAAAILANGRRVLRLSWVPLTAALLSLVLSITSIYINSRQPEVLMILPDVVRVAGGHQSGASYLYLQPAFVSTGTNDRVEVIRDMRLNVELEGGAAATQLHWAEQIRLVNGAPGAGLSYEHEADAVPLLVSPKSAAAPLSLFQAPSGWFFGEGTYRFTLSADRVVASDPLRARFSVVIRAEDLTVLNAPGPERFLTYPVQLSGG